MNRGRGSGKRIEGEGSEENEEVQRQWHMPELP
jgi:hypothetical protein